MWAVIQAVLTSQGRLSTCPPKAQHAAGLPRTDPDIPTDTGHTWTRQKEGMQFIPCCTAGAERLAEGLGDRSLERTEQAAERAAGLGLAVDQQRSMWKREEKRKV